MFQAVYYTFSGITWLYWIETWLFSNSVRSKKTLTGFVKINGKITRSESIKVFNFTLSGSEKGRWQDNGVVDWIGKDEKTKYTQHTYLKSYMTKNKRHKDILSGQICKIWRIIVKVNLIKIGINNLLRPKFVTFNNYKIL